MTTRRGAALGGSGCALCVEDAGLFDWIVTGELHGSLTGQVAHGRAYIVDWLSGSGITRHLAAFAPDTALGVEASRGWRCVGVITCARAARRRYRWASADTNLCARDLSLVAARDRLFHLLARIHGAIVARPGLRSNFRSVCAPSSLPRSATCVPTPSRPSRSCCSPPRAVETRRAPRSRSRSRATAGSSRRGRDGTRHRPSRAT